MFVCIILIYSNQALSKRIHYGKFVAEAKFRENPSAYETAIKSQVPLQTYTFHQLFLQISADNLISTFRNLVSVGSWPAHEDVNIWISGNRNQTAGRNQSQSFRPGSRDNWERKRCAAGLQNQTRHCCRALRGLDNAINQASSSTVPTEEVGLREFIHIASFLAP